MFLREALIDLFDSIRSSEAEYYGSLGTILVKGITGRFMSLLEDSCDIEISKKFSTKAACLLRIFGMTTSVPFSCLSDLASRTICWKTFTESKFCLISRALGFT
jgi:hypothetical protein